MSAARRAVVTGLGAVSPLGAGVERTWDAALTGRSGVTRREDGRLVAQVPAEDVAGVLAQPLRAPDGRPCVGRAAGLAAAAVREALARARLTAGGTAAQPDLVVGTTMGEPSWIDTWPAAEAALTPPPRHRAQELLQGSPDGLAEQVATLTGARGRVSAVGGACAAGNYALARALDEIRSGRSDVVLAVGVDAFSRTALLGFAKLGALAEDGCRPFGRDRQGLVLGEGAGCLVVESAEHAAARGAEPLAELAGAGLSADAHHPTTPRPDGGGAARALGAALDDAGVAPEEVAWVSAHGTGTPANDRVEVLALRTVFGPSGGPPASSLKSLTGHGLGAASAVEAVVAVQALRTGTAPPTWGVGEQDPDCDWDVLLDGPRPLAGDVVVDQAYAFGGCNAVTVFRGVR
ncbi:beta-ketoacyl-[acyl-carrier-protein] synthase family protein [Nocardioides caldifontis]|uniref:beta-ketoacyl-[acyl-carrier-protein] synthase family protein n=1 Tax=Nocardioides caldifontis TaxID=2588938 RepID=UPI0011DF7547|nr:beta-ketoacyl-[acyl-carrier-protein] synthase family protein [Nocardioides caldifontis]